MAAIKAPAAARHAVVTAPTKRLVRGERPSQRNAPQISAQANVAVNRLASEN